MSYNLRIEKRLQTDSFDNDMYPIYFPDVRIPLGGKSYEYMCHPWLLRPLSSNEDTGDKL